MRSPDTAGGGPLLLLILGCVGAVVSVAALAMPLIDDELAARVHVPMTRGQLPKHQPEHQPEQKPPRLE